MLANLLNDNSLDKNDKSLFRRVKTVYRSVQTRNRLMDAINRSEQTINRLHLVPLYFFHIMLFGTSMELFLEDDSQYFCILPQTVTDLGWENLDRV